MYMQLLLTNYLYVNQGENETLKNKVRTLTEENEELRSSKHMLQTTQKVKEEAVQEAMKSYKESQEEIKGNTVKPHLSGPHLSRLLTHLDTCLGTDVDDFIYRKCLTYPDIQLSGQSNWEQRCPDKLGSTVI